MLNDSVLERDGPKRFQIFLRVLALCVLISGAAQAGVIKKLSLDMVTTPIETVSQPVFDGSGVAPLAIGTITSAVDRKTVVRRLSSGVFTFGVRADLGPSVDLGALLAEAMRKAAPVMGLKVQPAESSGWRVSGTIKDAVLESMQETNYGPLVCYGYLDIELSVSKDGGEARQLRVRAHEMNYVDGRSAAKGLVAVIRLASQEVLARLNREFLKAPPHAEVVSQLANLKAGEKMQIIDILRIGLSGDPDAVPALLDFLPENKGDRLRLVVFPVFMRVKGPRAYIIDALANLGSPAALPLLAERYASEKTNVRFSTLKAFDYIGGEEAMALVKKLGLADPEKSCKNLAERIVK
jgi:hypothetical protein